MPATSRSSDADLLLLRVRANQDNATRALHHLKEARVEVLAMVQHPIHAVDRLNSFTIDNNALPEASTLDVPEQHAITGGDHEATPVEIDRNWIFAVGQHKDHFLLLVLIFV